MTKRRKMSSSPDSPEDVEVKEENVLGNDYLIAKGRLQGVLKQLIERSESDSDSEGNKSKRFDIRRRKSETEPTAYRHTYVMKLFDRSVDLARFQEDTPLYPICRAWMANQPRNPQPIIKRRVSTPEPDNAIWTSGENVYRLPAPTGPFTSRVPSPIPEQLEKNKQDFTINYEDKPPVAREVLIRNHLRRWVTIKKKWIQTAVKNEERYGMSKHILQTIYNKAQETMLTD